MKAIRIDLYFYLILLLLLLHYLFNPFEFQPGALKVLSAGLVMISLWILELIPMPVVALLPLIIFPLWGVESLTETARNYADPIIFLFMGGFFIALAIEKWNLHQRIALSILKKSGGKGNHILLGFMASSFLISMWLSNTATTMMMFPIALSVLNVMGSNFKGTGFKKFSTSVLLSIAYASNIGGLSTIIGTPPNTAMVGLMNEEYQLNISFSDWFIVCFPLALMILALLYWVFTRVLFINKMDKNEATKAFIDSEFHKLKSWTTPERYVLYIFLATAFLWITKDLWVRFAGLPINDAQIALAGAFALFVVPSGIKKVKPEDSIDLEIENNDFQSSRLLEWNDTHKMAWGILLMFGGGLALAKSMESSGLMKLIGEGIAIYAPQHLFLLILLVATISIFLSEIMSNIAQVIVMVPILSSIAIAMGISPIIVCLPVTLAASCAGMLPMGTPPNAIAYSSGKIPLKEMLKAGFVLNLISILVISLFCYYFRISI